MLFKITFEYAICHFEEFCEKNIGSHKRGAFKNLIIVVTNKCGHKLICAILCPISPQQPPQVVNHNNREELICN